MAPHCEEQNCKHRDASEAQPRVIRAVSKFRYHYIFQPLFKLVPAPQ